MGAKILADIAEDEGNHVPKLSAYQVRKGVIDFILRRFSIDEITQGQAGEALQKVVRQVSQQYSAKMKGAFPKEVEQDIITRLIVRFCQTVPDTPYEGVVHPDVTLFMLIQEWLQIEWHHVLRRRKRTYEVLYILKEELDNWTTIPQKYTVTVLLDGPSNRYTSWIRAGFLRNSEAAPAPTASVSRPVVSSPDIRRHMVSLPSKQLDKTLATTGVSCMRNPKGNRDREQSPTIDTTNTTPRPSSTNWLRQLATKRPLQSTPETTRGHKAKKQRNQKRTTGISDETDGPEYNTFERVSVSKSSSTSSSRIETDKTGVPYDERSSSQSNMSDAIGSHSSNSIRSWIIDSPQAIVNPQDEESPTAVSRKRRMETEEDSNDPLWLQQPQEEFR